MCYDSYDQEGCDCENPEYPHQWAGETCSDEKETDKDKDTDWWNDDGSNDNNSGEGTDYYHNIYRRKHCDTPDAVYDAELAADAQAYANTCPTDHAAERNGAGENLYWAGFSTSWGGSAPSADQSY